MKSHQSESQNGVFKRTLCLYGLYTLVSNSSFLIGYHLLPEGVMRGTPMGVIAEFVAAPESFWPEFGRTLVMNIGWVTVLCVLLNLMKVRGFSLGYFLPISLGIVSGLIVGTNSFAIDDLARYSVREGMALGFSIGEVEILGYILVIAATVKLGIYQRDSWCKWSDRFVKVMDFGEIRLSKREMLLLVMGVVLVVLGAYRETMMAMNL
ncbi:MAG: hypothetical protein WBB22_11850 [Anaerolineae bacterium]